MSQFSDPQRIRAAKIIPTFLATIALANFAGCQFLPSNPAPTGARIAVETSAGKFVIALYSQGAPASCRQFQTLADQGFYDGVSFHRILPRRLITTGLSQPNGNRPAAPPLRNEWSNGLHHERGTIAMARRIGDPRLLGQPEMITAQNSASSEFFINLDHNTQYDRRQVDGAGITVFGRVVEGMDVVDAIAKTPVRRNPKTGEPGNPVNPVTIIRARTLRLAQ